ncbi:hypothetical protein ERO13_A06G028200v2 [Gossypium hirsutum]|nr:hypothetical protein ERO13_A06G028200v2 [Gossypium hirsutum]
MPIFNLETYPLLRLRRRSVGVLTRAQDQNRPEKHSCEQRTEVFQNLLASPRCYSSYPIIVCP